MFYDPGRHKNAPDMTVLSPLFQQLEVGKYLEATNPSDPLSTDIIDDYDGTESESNVNIENVIVINEAENPSAAFTAGNKEDENVILSENNVMIEDVIMSTVVTPSNLNKSCVDVIVTCDICFKVSFLYTFGYMLLIRHRNDIQGKKSTLEWKPI